MTTIGIALAVYVALVITVGIVARGRSSDSPEDYFLAGRGLGTFVLFMALFGTNCTAFILVGIPGKAYHDGVGIFGVNAPIIALGVPLTFWAIGSPARRMAARLGALTPAELYARRFQSKGLGYLLFFCFTLYTLPYMATAVQGAAITLAGVSQGAIPMWAGGLGVLVVALIYTSLGGMRATAWTNVLQGLIFVVFMVAAFFLISGSMGGLSASMAHVKAQAPDLLTVGEGKLFTPRAWFSWAIIISLTVIAFPHMLVRLMSGSNEDAIKGASRLYPPALVLLWLPAVLLGVWGAAEFPDLEGHASDRIFALMVGKHLPTAMAAIGFLAVLAAVMSTLDAQILTLSSMLVRDVLEPLGQRRTGAGSQVRAGRIFGVAVAGAAYATALIAGKSVFAIATIAFSGYVTLVPTLFFGVRWQRFTVAGAVASILTGNAVLALALTGALPLFGFLPAFWGIAGATAAAIGVSLATSPSNEADTQRAFGG